MARRIDNRIPSASIDATLSLGDSYELHDSKRAQTAPTDALTAVPSSASSTLYAISSTREPSREAPPKTTAHESALSNPTLGPAMEENCSADECIHRKRRRKPSFISQERGVVLSRIDAELAELRPKLQEQTQKVARLKDEIKKAKEREKCEARNMRGLAAERQQRRMKLTSRLQAVVRGWLVRKRVIAALDHRTVHSMKMAAMLPDLLKEQLMQLQHGVHDLVYRPEDRVGSAVRIQAWWRAIVARRVVKVIKLAQQLSVIGRDMSSKATALQAIFRGNMIKRKFREQIRDRMENTSRKQYREMELAMHCIIKIQQSYRAKLARRQLLDFADDANREAQARASHKPSEASVEDDLNQKVIVDTWMPAMAAGAEAAGPGRAGVIIKKPPRHDWELDKLEDAGHVLFYGASSETRVRHKIGGATALLMQQQLGIGRSRDDERVEDSHDDNMAVFSDPASLEGVLGDPWNVYPEGLTPGFLSSLSKDVWEKGGRAKSYDNALKLRGVQANRPKKSKQRGPRPCTKVLREPPCNATQRARQRQDIAEHDCIDILAVANADNHPMFVNAPSLPPSRKGFSGRSPRFFRPALADAEEEGSWDVPKVQDQPEYRSERRPREHVEDLKQDLWNTLNVPFLGDTVGKNSIFGMKRKPGEVDHERVWSIANALAGQLSEKLPALSAG